MDLNWTFVKEVIWLFLRHCELNTLIELWLNCFKNAIAVPYIYARAAKLAYNDDPRSPIIGVLVDEWPLLRDSFMLYTLKSGLNLIKLLGAYLGA